jgi:hypothetical protein
MEVPSRSPSFSIRRDSRPQNRSPGKPRGMPSDNSWTSYKPPMRASDSNASVIDLINKPTSTAATRYSEAAEDHALAKNLSRQITRRWKVGDIYAPHDLSAAEMAKWKKRERPTRDVFDVLEFNPRDHYSVRLSLVDIAG